MFKPYIEYSKVNTRVFMESTEHTISTFLGSPIKITTVTMTPNDLMFVPLTGFQFPQALNFANFLMFREKIRNLRFFRFTIKFMFRVNASKGDVGRYIASWNPANSEAGINDWLPYLSFNTALPHAEIVCGPMKVSNLTIPFVSPFNCIDNNIQNLPYGTLRYYPMVPLSSVTTGSQAKCDIFALFEEVKLSVRAPTPIASANISTTDPYDAFWPPNPPMVVNQSGMKEIMSSMLTGAAETVGKSLSTKPKHNSVISVPPAWFGAAIKGGLELMGLNKNPTNEPNCRFSNVPGAGFTNADGVDQSVVLGANPLNAVAVDHTKFTTSQDDMDIPYIVSRLAYFDRFTWSFTSATDTLLWAGPVMPGLTPNEVTLPATNYMTTPLSFVASMFEFWKGAIVFRLSLVKNDFYTGRLVVAFASGVIPSVVNTLDKNTMPRIIWDISISNDIIITIPFKSFTTAMRVCLFKTPALTVDSTFSLGTLAIWVDTELVAPQSVVPNTITTLMYIGGGPDIQFGAPDFARYSPTLVPVTDLQTKNRKPISNDFVLVEKQGRLDFVHKEEYCPVVVNQTTVLKELTFNMSEQNAYGVETMMGNVMLYDDPADIDMAAPTMCYGEFFNNLRPLTKRFGILSQSYENSTGNLDPGFFFDNTGSIVTQVPLNYISTMYRFWAGSRRYKFIVNEYPVFTPATPTIQSQIQAAADVPKIEVFSQLAVSTAPADLTAGIRPDGAGNFRHIGFPRLNPVVEVQCPYYSTTHCQVVTSVAGVPQRSRMIYAFRISPRGGFYIPGSVTILTAAGDDFSFGFLLGTRLVVLRAS